MNKLSRWVIILSLVVVVGFIALVINFEGEAEVRHQNQILNDPIQLEESSSAKLSLRKSSQSSDMVEVELHYSIDSEETKPVVSELLINFDQKHLKVISAEPNLGTIQFFKEINNEFGKISIDLASLKNGFDPAQELLTISFEIIGEDIDSTLVSVDPISTLGHPNLLTETDVTLTLEI